MQTRIILLILLAAAMPFAWGWSVHWFVSKLWPEDRTRPPQPGIGPRSTPPLDYQI